MEGSELLALKLNLLGKKRRTPSSPMAISSCG